MAGIVFPRSVFAYEATAPASMGHSCAGHQDEVEQLEGTWFWADRPELCVLLSDKTSPG